MSTPRSSLGSELFRGNDDVIGCPALSLVRGNDVTVAPLPKIRRNTLTLVGLKRAADARVLTYKQLTNTAYTMAPEGGLATPVSAALRHEPKGSNPAGRALTRLANDKAVGS